MTNVLANISTHAEVDRDGDETAMDIIPPNKIKEEVTEEGETKTMSLSQLEIDMITRFREKGMFLNCARCICCDICGVLIMIVTILRVKKGTTK